MSKKEIFEYSNEYKIYIDNVFEYLKDLKKVDIEYIVNYNHPNYSLTILKDFYIYEHFLENIFLALRDFSIINPNQKNSIVNEYPISNMLKIEDLEKLRNSYMHQYHIKVFDSEEFSEIVQNFDKEKSIGELKSEYGESAEIINTERIVIPNNIIDQFIDFKLKSYQKITNIIKSGKNIDYSKIKNLFDDYSKAFKTALSKYI